MNVRRLAASAAIALMATCVLVACAPASARLAAAGPTANAGGTATATPSPSPTATDTVIVVENPAPAAPPSRPAAATPAAVATAGPARTIVLSGHGVPVVVLDPGHGGAETGAAANGIIERDSNLDMAQRTAVYLKAAGVDVVLTREDENRAAGDNTSGGFQATRRTCQARVHLANQVGAAVFVSLHSNGSSDSDQRGVEAYWDSRRPWADKNQQLAQLLLNGVVDSLDNAGYPTRNRGTIDGACWRNNNGRCVGLFVLSPEGGPGNPASPASKEATNMPAALVESLFISNAQDATELRTDAARDAVAHGLARGILQFLGLPA